MLEAWDQNAQLRHEQIVAGKDLSFSKLLVPELLEILQGLKDFASFSVLDVGCGTGDLSHTLAKHVRHVLGIEPSRKSFLIAKDYTKNDKNVLIKRIRIESFIRRYSATFDFVVAHMVLQALDPLLPALRNISKALKRRGYFVLTVPHPCFWPIYKKEITQSNYQYHISSFHQVPFTISNDPNPLPSFTPYFHRSLEEYSSALHEAGFTIERLREPFPSSELLAQYSNQWTYPRHMIFVCRKQLPT